jgi:hypothetical protein
MAPKTPKTPKPPKPPPKPDGKPKEPDKPTEDDRFAAQLSILNAIDAEILRQELDEYNFKRAMEELFTIGNFDSWADEAKQNFFNVIDAKKATIKPTPGNRPDKPKIKIVSTQKPVQKTSQTKRKKAGAK